MRYQRILIVEDEIELQLLLREALAPLGAEIHVAGTLDEAQSAILAHDFDVVLSDQQLHGEAGGLKLFEICMNLCPDTRFLLMSAFPDLLFMGLKQTGIRCPPFLPKPFRVQECRKLVKSLLETPSLAPLPF
jgi:DNA-binding NtrC family response regulator